MYIYIDIYVLICSGHIHVYVHLSAYILSRNRHQQGQGAVTASGAAFCTVAKGDDAEKKDAKTKDDETINRYIFIHSYF